MPTRKTARPIEIYQLKVTLLGTRPPIWRRLLVPADATLERLHRVLQVVMGWENCHMHEFVAGGQRFGKPQPEELLMGLPGTVSERTARLSNMLRRVRAKALYTYDFGDSWEHDIVLEKILPPDPVVEYPLCTGGAGRCPPEDCGGIPGYYDLLEALGDPSHEDHEELLEWVGEDFDPKSFSVEMVNLDLAPLRGKVKD